MLIVHPRDMGEQGDPLPQPTETSRFVEGPGRKQRF